MKQYLSIGAMAELNGLTIQRLRYYDNIGLFSPIYTDPISKYRYYTKSQSKQLATIQSLQYIGFSLHEIKEVFDHDSTYDISALLQKKSQLLAEQEARITRKKQVLQMYRKANTIPEEKNMTIKTRHLPAFSIFVIPSTQQNFIQMSDDEYLHVQKDIRLLCDRHNLSRGFIPYIYLPKPNSLEQYLFFYINDTTLNNPQATIPESDYLVLRCRSEQIEKAIQTLHEEANGAGLDFFVEPLQQLLEKEPTQYLMYHRLKPK